MHAGAVGVGQEVVFTVPWTGTAWTVLALRSCVAVSEVTAQAAHETCLASSSPPPGPHPTAWQMLILRKTPSAPRIP